MLHALILSTRLTAGRYRIRQTQAGHYDVWRFTSWKRDCPGWRLIDRTRTEDEAYQAIHEHSGLSDPAPREPVEVQRFVTFRPAEDYDDGDWQL